MKIFSSRRIKFIYLVVFLYPLLVRSLYVEDFIFNRISKRLYGSFQVVAHDSLIYFVMLLLFYISFIKRLPKPLTVLLRIAAIVIFVVYVMDIIVLKTFNTRLTVVDFLKYVAYAPTFIQIVYGGVALFFIGFILTMFVGLSIFLLFQNHALNHKTHGIFLLTLSLLVFSSCLRDNKGYVFSWMYKNVAEYNSIMISQNSFYSEEFISNVMGHTSLEENESCVKHKPQRKSIIILMVESLSPYQSKFFSGIRNWTPNIDSIAENNLCFTNFYSNGFITEDAELSILTGMFPIYGPFRKTKNRGSNFFRGYYGVPNSLPLVARMNGYITEFVTSADLNFSDTGNWAKSIGFDYMEGHEHPYYNTWKRYHFKAAPDEALYNRVFDRVLRNRLNKPYLLFVKTVSTHHPHINPENENYSESETVRYADKQLGRFYKKLSQNGFFIDGILVIVGDHRTMLPLRREEIKQLGGVSKAWAKTPLIISCGDKGRVVEDRPFQQVDLCNGLKNLISDEQCTSAWIGDLISSPRLPARYIVYRHGDNRDIISVFYGGREICVKLDGDKTRILNPGDLDDSILKLIVHKINKERISNQLKGN